ncbi:VOC family protein [Frigidibacter sp. RF13]|uniref:VOC family protein n=1 Tax=Frigidibacter sp. RF13 TaxID=2997340 RepID=UPI00226FB7A2|nr:VOC family protein [Frigidibacter sp. RF13]MCY1128723.1 VOC family protein [Frigidibacter sp. RF13]
MKAERVTLITLGVADLGRSRAFYEAWGWRAHPRSMEALVLFQMNGLALALFDLASLAEDQARPAQALGTGAMTLAQNMESEADVDATFARAVAAGGAALKTPQKVFWGGYSGYFADPDGHVWEIAHNPFWPLDADGCLTLPEPI